ARADKGTERPRENQIEYDDEDESPAASMPLRRPSMTPPPIARKEQKAKAAGALPLEPADSASRARVARRMGGYPLPPLTLLDAQKAERKIDERELMEGARLLEEKCREFSVEGTVVQIHPGPVV